MRLSASDPAEQLFVLDAAGGAGRTRANLTAFLFAENVREKTERGDSQTDEPAVPRVAACLLRVGDRGHAVPLAKADVGEPTLTLARGE
jgi:hypothetical protein